MNEPEVLICGAGPTGLVLALWLTKFGVRIRIVDKLAEAGTASRAVAIAARTLELYESLGIADDVVRRSHPVQAVNLWARGEAAARLPVREIGAGMSRYSVLRMFPQDEHEKLLIDRLKNLGVEVERSTELTSYREAGDRIVAQLRGPDGGGTACTAAFLAGCDGGHSIVRKTIGAGFEGGTYAQRFYVADIRGTGKAANGELHVDLDQADFVALFPLSADGHARLIGTVRDERADDARELGFEDVRGTALGNLDLEVREVKWFSTYRVHHRVADRFRLGRAFLVGDAAHLHSPVGGQGMNTGIGDAANLAWKLAAVLRGRATDALLDSYQSERIRFARRLVGTTDRVFSFVSAEGSLADLVRTRLAPPVIARLLSIASVRRFLFRTVSQLGLEYHGSPLSTGQAGTVRGGDRLPWVEADGHDNHAPLAEACWQVHIYGSAPAGLESTCRDRALKLHVFDWTEAHAGKGLARGAVYLLRPDGYVALATRSPADAAMAAYFTTRNLQP